MTITFRPAIRSSAKLLVGLYSESGCGKTLSALLLARGFVGPNGTIGMIETESGRGEAYADTLQGGYSVLSLRESFSPEAYGEAISAAEQSGFGALIIDSASHEWEGVGGVLDMAAKNEEAGKKGLLIWQKPKISHAREFMLRLMQTSIPLVIVCMRAKYPMEGTGKDMKRSTVLEPKQSADILFEMMVHGWIDYDHNIHITKPRNKAEDRTGIINTVFADGKPITIETGERLAKWAAGGNAEIPPKAYDYDAALDAMRGAVNSAQLQSAYTPAYSRARKDGDQATMDILEKCKDECKLALGLPVKAKQEPPPAAAHGTITGDPEEGRLDNVPALSGKAVI